MNKLLLSLILSLSVCVSCTAQNELNGSFEKINPTNHSPEGWNYVSGKVSTTGYLTQLDSLVKHSGSYSTVLQKKQPGEGFGVFSYTIPKTFEGKTISLVGYIKTEEVANGFAGMWLRLDGEDGQSIALDNMANQGLNGTKDWKKYSISLPYNTDAVRIIVGGLLVGDGKAWFDDLELSIDGKNVMAMKPSTAGVQEKDTAFNKGSKVEAFNPTAQQLTNLAVAGQFWGFLKYHHPAVAKGDYNWDAELFRLLPTVIAAKDNAALSSALENYLTKLPGVKPCENCPVDHSKSTVKPNYGDLFTTKVLSPALTNKLNGILKNGNVKENHYISMFQGVGNPKFQNEKAYADMKYPDAGYQLLSLFRYWNMINYFFPYKYQIDGDWNKMLYESIPQFLAAKDELGYDLAALKLIAKISDTHANLWNNNGVIDRYKGIRTTPFKAKFIEDKLIVTGFYTDTMGIRNKVKIGDEILTINGRSVPDLIKAYLPITAASNYDTQLRDLPGSSLLGSNNATLALGMRNKDGKFDLDVPLVNLRQTYKNIEYTKPTGYHLLNKDIGYIYPAKYKNTDLPEVMKLFSNTKGIIVDMRCYPSDFMPFTFGNYIKKDRTAFVKFTTGSVSRPGTFVIGQDLKNGAEPSYQKKSTAYNGKVIVIVNADSQSQAEYTTMAFQSSPNVKVLGSQTAGADGNVSTIVLPGGISSMISGIGIFYPDGTPTQRVGVKIDYPMKPTVKGITEGKDELLEKAVALLETSK
jgi:C-terminal processing protease CtpA/Prc